MGSQQRRKIKMHLRTGAFFTTSQYRNTGLSRMVYSKPSGSIKLLKKKYTQATSREYWYCLRRILGETALRLVYGKVSSIKVVIQSRDNVIPIVIFYAGVAHLYIMQPVDRQFPDGRQPIPVGPAFHRQSRALHHFYHGGIMGGNDGE